MSKWSIRGTSEEVSVTVEGVLIEELYSDLTGILVQRTETYADGSRIRYDLTFLGQFKKTELVPEIQQGANYSQARWTK